MTLSARAARSIAAAALGGLLGLSALTADAAIIRYGSDLEAEAVGATGTGSVVVEYDDVEHTLRIIANWMGLTGLTSIAHIHCCTPQPGSGTAGVAVTPGTLPGFPTGLTAGTYTSPLIDLDLASSFTTTFVNTFGGGTIAGATNALLTGMAIGTAYFNVHTSVFPGGEIRGFLQKVPEAGTLPLVLLSLAGWAGLRARRR
jgi:hypothetical protein